MLERKGQEMEKETERRARKPGKAVREEVSHCPDVSKEEIKCTRR